ncbi:MAG: glycosyltransferase family 2 protein [Prevotellaceae bacterium]|jgi:GT2 family glycosyltransferase|nr:glycosyltransferase family 2 protein [Prevotellaceae bacterium]
MKSNIAIIILNYKRYDLTIDCIKKIIEYNEDVSLIVVDNFSENHSLENIKKSLPNVPSVLINEDDTYCINTINRIFLIQAKNNYGYAKGNNIGIRFALKGNFEYIAILNNDIIVKDDIFKKMSDYISNVSRDYVLFGPLLYYGDGHIDYNCTRKKFSFVDLLLSTPLVGKLSEIFWKKRQVGYDYMNSHPQDVDIIKGCFMFFRKDLFDKIDGFDPNTFLYFEEPILCKKIHDAGYKVMFLPMFNAIHLHSATVSMLPDSKIYQANEMYKSMAYYLENYSDFTIWEKMTLLTLYKISILLLIVKSKYQRIINP